MPQCRDNATALKVEAALGKKCAVLPFFGSFCDFLLFLAWFYFFAVDSFFLCFDLKTTSKQVKFNINSLNLSE